MKTFFRIFAIIILTLFVLLFPVSLLMKDFGAILFDPETTRELIENNLLNEDSISKAIRTSLENFINNGSNQSPEYGAQSEKVLGALDEDDWREISSLIAPAPLLQETANRIVMAISEWLESDEDIPNLTINMQAWKQSIINNAEPLTVIILNALPDCTKAELSNQIIEGLLSGEGFSGSIPGCKPPEPIYSFVIDQSIGLAIPIVQTFPEEIDFSQLNSQSLEQLQGVKQAISQVKFILNWTWVMLILFAMIGLSLTARKQVEILRWIGWPIFFEGFGTYFLSKGSTLFSTLAFSNLLNNALADMPDLLRSILKTVLLALGDGLVKPLAIQSGLLIGLGLLAITSSALLKRKENEADK